MMASLPIPALPLLEPGKGGATITPVPLPDGYTIAQNPDQTAAKPITMLGKNCAGLNGYSSPYKFDSKLRPAMVSNILRNPLKKVPQEGNYILEQVGDECGYGLGSFIPGFYYLPERVSREKVNKLFSPHQRAMADFFNQPHLTDKYPNFYKRTVKSQDEDPQSLMAYFTNSVAGLSVEIIPAIPMPTEDATLYSAESVAILGEGDIIGMSRVDGLGKGFFPECPEYLCFSIDRFRKNSQGHWDIDHLFYTPDYLFPVLVGETMIQTVIDHSADKIQGFAVRQPPYDSYRLIKLSADNPKRYGLEGGFILNGDIQLILSDSSYCIDTASATSDSIDTIECSYKFDNQHFRYNNLPAPFQVIGTVLDGYNVAGFAVGWINTMGFPGPAPEQLVLRATNPEIINAKQLLQAFPQLSKQFKNYTLRISDVAGLSTYNTTGNLVAFRAVPAGNTTLLPYVLSFFKW